MDGARDAIEDDVIGMAFRPKRKPKPEVKEASKPKGAKARATKDTTEFRAVKLMLPMPVQETLLVYSNRLNLSMSGMVVMLTQRYLGDLKVSPKTARKPGSGSEPADDKAAA